MKFFAFLVFTCGFVMITGVAFSQSPAPPDSSRSYFLAAKYQRGYIVKNSPRVAALVNNDVQMVQLDFSLLKNTQRAWDYCHCYTKTGVSLSYVDFANPDNLGHAVNLIAFTEPYLSFSSKLQVTIRGGAGFSYLNRVYDKEANPLNIFYSSHLSFLLMLNANLYYAVTPQFRISLTGQYDHISNGGTKAPNWGVNFPVLGLGVEIKPDHNVLTPRIKKPFTDRSARLFIHALGGLHTVNEDAYNPAEKFFVTGVNIGVVKPLSLVNGFGVGIELYYDEASKELESRTGNSYTPWVTSLSLQHYIFFGKMIFSQQLAVYTSPLNPNVSSDFYQRYILEYQVYGPWYTGLTLKAHGDVSDYLAFSVSRVVRLGKRK